MALSRLYALDARKLGRRVAVLLASRDAHALFQVMDERDEAMSLEGEHELGDHVAMRAGDHCRQLA